MTLEEVKLYLRIDGDSENETISDFIEAAIAYSQEQTGKIYSKEKPLWKLLIKRYCARWNENRGENFTNSTAQDPSIEMLLKHIALCGDY